MTPFAAVTADEIKILNFSSILSRTQLGFNRRLEIVPKIHSK